MERQPLIMKDPILLAGSAHTAVVNVPVSPSGMACTAELFLSLDNGKTKAATSGAVSFTQTQDGYLQNISKALNRMSDSGGYKWIIDDSVVKVWAIKGEPEPPDAHRPIGSGISVPVPVPAPLPNSR